MKKSEYFTVAEIAEMLSVSKRMVQIHCKRGILPSKRLGNKPLVGKDLRRVIIPKNVIFGDLPVGENDVPKYLKGYIEAKLKERNGEKEERKPDMIRGYITLKQYAEYHRIHIETARRRYREGKFKDVKKIGKKLYIPKKYEYVEIPKKKYSSGKKVKIGNKTCVVEEIPLRYTGKEGEPK